MHEGLCTTICNSFCLCVQYHVTAASCPAKKLAETRHRNCEWAKYSAAPPRVQLDDQSFLCISILKPAMPVAKWSQFCVQVFSIPETQGRTTLATWHPRMLHEPQNTPLFMPFPLSNYFAGPLYVLYCSLSETSTTQSPAYFLALQRSSLVPLQPHMMQMSMRCSTVSLRQTGSVASCMRVCSTAGTLQTPIRSPPCQRSMWAPVQQTRGRSFRPVACNPEPADALTDALGRDCSLHPTQSMWNRTNTACSLSVGLPLVSLHYESYILPPSGLLTYAPVSAGVSEKEGRVSRSTNVVFGDTSLEKWRALDKKVSI